MNAKGSTFVEYQHGTETFPSAFSCFMTQFFWMHVRLSSLVVGMFFDWKSGTKLEAFALFNQNKAACSLIRKCFGFSYGICINWRGPPHGRGNVYVRFSVISLTNWWFFDFENIYIEMNSNYVWVFNLLEVGIDMKRLNIHPVKQFFRIKGSETKCDGVIEFRIPRRNCFRRKLFFLPITH